MKGSTLWNGGLLIMTATLAIGVVGCTDTPTTPTVATSYINTRLVADDSKFGAAHIDADLKNPWGMAFGPTGILWVANNRSGTSTLYDSAGMKLSTVVRIPSGFLLTAGSPTGMLYNSTNDFVISGEGRALFIFAGEDGTISAWSTGGGGAKLMANRSGNDAVYKGIAMATDGGANYLYATNFKGAVVDVFNGTYQYVKSFTDPDVPPGYGPFGIQNIEGKLYVTFAKQKRPDNEDDEAGAGNGYVDIFNPNGTLVRRFVSNGTLNSPWAIILAPTGFGSISGNILIGNFGDGRIGAYDASTGAFRGMLHDANNATIAIEGLWGLTFGPNSGSPTLYYTAGPDDEDHGLLGTLKPE